MTESWFVEQNDGTVDGPLTEKRIREELLAGRIAGELRVRQGQHGEWCAAQKVAELFQQLFENGWYVGEGDEVYGPFTSSRVVELHRAGEISPTALLRKGTTGEWSSAAKRVGIWAGNPPVPDAKSTSPKWSVEPIRHQAMILVCDPTNETPCHPQERLFLRMTESGEQVTVERSNGQSLGRLNPSDSMQVVSAAERGFRQIAIYTEGQRGTIHVVMCPPGTSSSESRQYINRHFASPT